MVSLPELVASFVLLWAVIDPIGTIPVFLSVTRGRSDAERRRIALLASTTAAGILLFFIIAGELILVAMGVPLPAFQIAGGLVLFLFALSMIFGESKPEGEVRSIRSAQDTAIFPLATPSIASPGAMLAVVLLTENNRHSFMDQAATSLVMLSVIAIAYVLMLGAGHISKWMSDAGASIVSRVMGLILASIAATNVLEGIKDYFS